jgi:flagellar M-ring protein FliF
VNQTLGKAKGFMTGFTAGQRSVVIVAILALLMGGYALSRWVAQPDWEPLYGGLSGTDASSVTQQLGTDGVKYKLAEGGTTILVPKDKVYSERIALAGKGLPAGSGTSSDPWSLLDKQGITSTDFQQNVAYQRALSGELAKTLEAMDGVNTAVVNLAIPAKDVFSDDTQKTTASVLVSVTPGKSLTTDQISSITHLVAGSVPELDPANVSVSDQTGKLLSGDGTGAAAASAADEQTASYEDRLDDKVQQMLDQIVGPGNSVVRVNAQLDFNDSTTTSQTYAQPTPGISPLSQANVNEQYSGNGTTAGGTLGQLLPTPLATASGNGSYSRDQSTTNNSVDTSIQKTTAAPGQVQRLTVAVVLNSKTAGTLNPTQIQSQVANAVGLNTTRGDAIQVSTMPFDTTAAAAAAKALSQAQSAQKTAGYIDLAKKAGLVLLVIIVLILFMRGRRKKEQETMIQATASDLPAGQPVLVGGGPSALESGQQLALTREADVNRERQRQDVAALVDSQPDDVAALLQGWLAEGK